MREVFNFQRTGVYWWGLLTASVFLIPGQWQRALVQFLRTTDLFNSDRPPFTWFANAGTWIDVGTASAVANIKFDPQAGLFYIGNFGLANVAIAGILAVLLLGFVFIFYARATKTKGILDDLLAMVAIYFALRFVGAAAKGLKLPILDFIQKEEPRSYLLILTVFMILLMLAGKAAVDSRVFFKVLFEGVLIWFLIVPGPTIQAISFLLEIPVNINYTLQSEPNIRNYYVAIVAGWAIFGLFLAGTSIYTSGKPPPPPPDRSPADDLDDAIRMLSRRKGRFQR